MYPIKTLVEYCDVQKIKKWELEFVPQIQYKIIDNIW